MSALPLPSQAEVELAFAREMESQGFMPGPIQADTPDFVRFDAPGDKPGRRNGFYKLITGQFPVGWFGDWKSGEQYEWFFRKESGRELTAKERAAIKREQARLKEEADAARALRHKEVAEDASDMWKRADGNVEGHGYLERKRISVPRQLRIYQAKDGTRLIAVPMWAFDDAGTAQLVSLQLIDGEGSKRFLKAGRVEGAFFSIKGDTSVIVICEGVATAFSIWEATGLSVVAAFNAGNLIEVAKAFQRHRPTATLLIAGDDDAIEPENWQERGRGRKWDNPGRSKAQATARAVGCRWIVPTFRDGPDRSRTDFNDLHLLEGLDAVREQINGVFQLEAEDAAPGAKVVEIDRAQDESWRAELPKNSQGKPDGSNVEGVALFIAHHRLLRGRLRFNLLTKEMEIDGNPMEDYQVAEFRRIMHAEGFKAKKADVQDEMEAEARRNQFDPLIEYLTGLAWDNKPRLKHWLTEYLGTTPSTYADTVGRKFLIGAVARAMNPGCKMDTMLVLEGEQGTGKSTALRYLFGDRFFIDNLPDFHSKDSFQQLQGAWCIEVAELSALSKADVKDVKQFLSRLVDKFRPPYGHNPIQVPRRTVFAGTVNPEEGGYLRDPTGARRFWPVDTHSIDLAGVLRDRDQLWAEAVAAYVAHERWHLEDDETVKLATEQQQLRREVHPWETTIEAWLVSQGSRSVTVAELLTDALKITPDRQDTRQARAVGACMRALKWKAETQRPYAGAKPMRVFVSPAALSERKLV